MRDPYILLDRTVRAWDAHERSHGRLPVVAYDLDPVRSPAQAAGRTLTMGRLAGLETTHRAPVRSHKAYLQRLEGDHGPLEAYVAATQQGLLKACSDGEMERRRHELTVASERVGVTFGPSLAARLTAAEAPVASADLEGLLFDELRRWRPLVAAQGSVDVNFDLTIEQVRLDVYWSYWLDGSGSRARLRINLRHAQFTATQVRQFALHELCGHALQCASWSSRRWTGGTARFPATHCVHLGQQPGFEGLGQALPLFVADHDPQLAARTRLTLYTQLAYGRAHSAIAGGAGQAATEAELLRWLPWWDPAGTKRFYGDRAEDALLASYLWSYPAGAAFFWDLADAGEVAARRVLAAAYDRPLTLSELAALAEECVVAPVRHDPPHD